MMRTLTYQLLLHFNRVVPECGGSWQDSQSLFGVWEMGRFWINRKIRNRFKSVLGDWSERTESLKHAKEVVCVVELVEQMECFFFFLSTFFFSPPPSLFLVCVGPPRAKKINWNGWMDSNSWSAVSNNDRFWLKNPIPETLHHSKNPSFSVHAAKGGLGK